MGEGGISTQQLPHFRRTLLKLKTKKHVGDIKPHTKLGKDRPTAVVWANTRILTVYSGLRSFLFDSSLSVPFAPRFLLRPVRAQSKRVFPAKEVPFGGPSYEK